MKRSPLVFAALAPLVAVAGGGGDKMAEKVNHEELRDDWRVSEVIGSDVRANDGQEVGQIEDVILSDDGDIASIMVKVDDAGQSQNRNQDRTQEPVYGESESGQQGGEARTVGAENEDEQMYTERGGSATTGSEGGNNEGLFGMGGSENVVSVQWDNPSFNADENVVELNMSASELENMAGSATNVSATSVDQQRRDGQTDIYGSDDASGAGSARTGTTDTDATGSGDVQAGTTGGDEAMTGSTQVSDTSAAQSGGQSGGLRASELLGMEVSLSDEESYGEIGDVLISQDGKASAFVVDGGNFFQSEQYALPVNAEGVNQQEGSVRYDISAEELENMEEFNPDEDLDQTS